MAPRRTLELPRDVLPDKWVRNSSAVTRDARARLTRSSIWSFQTSAIVFSAHVWNKHIFLYVFVADVY